MPTRVKYFVSYAHRNKKLVEDFLARLEDVLAPSKSYSYEEWTDHNLIVGEDWEEQILIAIQECDVGLLLISPAFLASKFIAEKELPKFLYGEKPSFPAMLQPVDFKRHDLKGLEKRQIFRFDNPEFSEPRAYGECSDSQRDGYVLDLFRKMEQKLDSRGNKQTELTRIDPIRDQRILELAAKAYRERGTPKLFLDGQDLTMAQKAALYEKVVFAERGRPAKSNPYR